MMLFWQAMFAMVGAIVALTGRILRREKIATVGAVMVFLGASAIIYSVLAVIF